jgi:hypothetical protein
MKVNEQHELRRGPFAELLGRDVGSAVSLIFVDTDVDVDGNGPALQRHPYQGDPVDPRGHGHAVDR